MLPSFAAGESYAPLTVNKISDGRDATFRGAFASGEKPCFSLTLPRRAGVICPVLRIRRDTGAPGEEALDSSPHDIPFVRKDGAFGGFEPTDTYSLTLDLAEMCGDGGSGLFYYEIIFMRGLDTLFSDSVDNVRFRLSEKSGVPFRLLVYPDGFETPDVGGGIMYHVFVDRFARGKGPVSYKGGARVSELPPDRWKPGYAAVRGGNVDNLDFFGGSLWGVAEKIPYLRSLGVSMIYLSPVSDSPSNHKYDTSDYMKVDGGFGGDEALLSVISEAKKAGMKVIIDGVYNHTGDESPYFRAASDPASSYRDWYCFDKDAQGGIGYECWWGIRILPKLNLGNPAVRDFITAPGGVAEKYIKMGVSGIRLDVADELPDDFLSQLRETVKKADPQGFIVGEVWENAADKIAYGRRRGYFRGKQLDSVMNYPFRSAVIDFVRYRDSGFLADELTEIYASYPRCVCDVLMNVVGTHDTERVLTLLGAPERALDACGESDNAKLEAFVLSASERAQGIRRLKLVSTVQYTVYGFPCVYYGDENGMEGMGDPFCRRPFDSSHRDEELFSHYKKLGEIRRGEDVFNRGEFRVTRVLPGYIEYVREKNGRRVTVAANMSDMPVALDAVVGTELLSGSSVNGSISVEPETAVIVAGNI